MQQENSQETKSQDTTSPRSNDLPNLDDVAPSLRNDVRASLKLLSMVRHSPTVTFELTDEQWEKVDAVVLQAAELGALRGEREERSKTRLKVVQFVAACPLTAAVAVRAWGLQPSLLWALALAATQVLAFYVPDRVLLRLPERYFDNNVVRAVAIAVMLWPYFGVGALIYIIARPYPGLGLALLLTVFLAGAAMVIGAILKPIVTLVISGPRRAVARSPDPYPVLILRLLEIFFSMTVLSLKYAASQEPYARGPIWVTRDRAGIAVALEDAAVRMESDLPRSFPRVGLDQISRTARAELTARGRRVAAWLRALQVEILLPSPTAPSSVRTQIAHGLVAACLGEWECIERQPKESPTQSLLHRLLPRAISTAVLLTSAWLLPQALHDFDIIGNGEMQAVRVTLIVAAVGALLAPRDAVSAALDELKKKVEKPSSPPTL